MKVSADVNFVDYYYYSTAMGDPYWDFVEDFLCQMDSLEAIEWEINESKRRSAVLN